MTPTLRASLGHALKDDASANNENGANARVDANADVNANADNDANGNSTCTTAMFAKISATHCSRAVRLRKFSGDYSGSPTSQRRHVHIVPT